MAQPAHNRQTLVENLIASAHSGPENTAFQFNTSKLTYTELLHQSSRLAAFLNSVGAKRGESVALLMPRCLEASTAIYGTMYCGCVWVPIDPGSPIKVVKQILAQCGIRFLLTHPDLAFLVNQLGTDAHTLEYIIGADQTQSPPSISCFSWEEALSGPLATFQSRPVLEDAAYVIHTSGSTGTPKGIVHSHMSGSSYAHLAADTFGLSSTDIIGSHGPLHTDMCTLGFLAGPLAGASTQIVSDAHVKVPASLSALIEQSGITVWYSVPQVVVQLLSAGVLEQRDLSRLRWLIYAGESLAPSRILQIRKHATQARVCNVYGPAETNQCMHYIADDQNQLQLLAESDQQLPIGNVWSETEAILLDDRNQVVDNSGQGELAIRSSTLMTGYQNDNRADSEIYYDCELTNHRFYRTGDLAKRDDTGVYTLIGRIGRQVKARGMRVELDAIELLLSKHPSVVVAAVIASRASDDPGTCDIQAAVTVSECCTALELQRYLRQHLPVQAVPQSIEIRDSIPLTSGGKIDRLRLSTELDAERPTICH